MHAQGIIHRDIKPDNCLITQDDVLKIVDFGVSEMFEKESSMATAKSAGSPAFMPPELCIAKHGQVSGKAADIWSMGVTLYCLRYGHIPFEKHGMLELYESIRNDNPHMDEETNPDFADLMQKLLEKDPEQRITIEELRVCTSAPDQRVCMRGALTRQTGSPVGDQERHRSAAFCRGELLGSCRTTHRSRDGARNHRKHEATPGRGKFR